MKCLNPKPKFGFTIDWNTRLVGVAKFISESLDVMLGADSDNQSQASDQPRWLELM